MQCLNVLLDIAPFELSEVDRQSILRICPDADLHVVPKGLSAQHDQMEGRDADVLVGELIPHHLESWPKLKFVQLVSAGIDHLIGHPIWERGIPVATASGIHSVPMAQFTTGALLTLIHRMKDITGFTSSRNWPDRTALAGSLLRGRTVGIVGYGNIGRECARQLHALGMRVVCLRQGSGCKIKGRFEAWPGTGDPEGTIPEQWFGPQELHKMLPLCDVLVITAPRTRDTRGMIGERELALLQPGSYVMIISRGGVVDEESLARALQAGQVGGAWVDCFLEEPPPASHPLFNVPNVILTPHMSGVYDEYWPVLLRLLGENLRRFSEGRTPLNVARGDLGY